MRTEQKFEERAAKIAALLQETEQGIQKFSNNISRFSNLITGFNFTGSAIKLGTGELEML
jgi:hypothetical protein